MCGNLNEYGIYGKFLSFLLKSHAGGSLFVSPTFKFFFFSFFFFFFLGGGVGCWAFSLVYIFRLLILRQFLIFALSFSDV